MKDEYYQEIIAVEVFDHRGNPHRFEVGKPFYLDRGVPWENGDKPIVSVISEREPIFTPNEEHREHFIEILCDDNSRERFFGRRIERISYRERAPDSAPAPREGK